MQNQAMQSSKEKLSHLEWLFPRMECFIYGTFQKGNKNIERYSIRTGLSLIHEDTLEKLNLSGLEIDHIGTYDDKIYLVVYDRRDL